MAPRTCTPPPPGGSRAQAAHGHGHVGVRGAAGAVAAHGLLSTRQLLLLLRAERGPLSTNRTTHKQGQRVQGEGGGSGSCTFVLPTGPQVLATCARAGACACSSLLAPPPSPEDPVPRHLLRRPTFKVTNQPTNQPTMFPEGPVCAYNGRNTYVSSTCGGRALRHRVPPVAARSGSVCAGTTGAWRCGALAASPDGSPMAQGQAAGGGAAN